MIRALEVRSSFSRDSSLSFGKSAETNDLPRALPRAKAMVEPMKIPATDRSAPFTAPKRKPPAIWATSPGITKTTTWRVCRPMKTRGAHAPHPWIQARSSRREENRSHSSWRQMKTGTIRAAMSRGKAASERTLRMSSFFTWTQYSGSGCGKPAQEHVIRRAGLRAHGDTTTGYRAPLDWP